jgi:hypothetical protein
MSEQGRGQTYWFTSKAQSSCSRCIIIVSFLDRQNSLRESGTPVLLILEDFPRYHTFESSELKLLEASLMFFNEGAVDSAFNLVTLFACSQENPVTCFVCSSSHLWVFNEVFSHFIVITARVLSRWQGGDTVVCTTENNFVAGETNLGSSPFFLMGICTLLWDINCRVGVHLLCALALIANLHLYYGHGFSVFLV